MSYQSHDLENSKQSVNVMNLTVRVLESTEGISQHKPVLCRA